MYYMYCLKDKCWTFILPQGLNVDLRAEGFERNKSQKVKN